MIASRRSFQISSSPSPLNADTGRTGESYRFFERAQRAGLLRSVQLVDLRRDDGDGRLHAREPRVAGRVLRKIRMPRVDELQHARDAARLARETDRSTACVSCFECLDRLVPAARVPVARKIDQVQRLGLAVGRIRSGSSSRAASCPGAALVRAIFCLTSALMRLDLPTFERPDHGDLGQPVRGNCEGEAAEKNEAAACDHAPEEPVARVRAVAFAYSLSTSY